MSDQPSPIMDDVDHQFIGSTMARYGTRFSRHIGHALMIADADDAAKICATWPELIEHYRAMAMAKMPEPDSD